MTDDPVTPTTASTPQARSVVDPLALAALDTERHVAAAGWDQNPRLFALVSTDALLAAEPGLADSLSADNGIPGGYTAIEQDGMPVTSDIESTLARIAWPAEVAGCAFVVERIVVPPDAERDLPVDADAAMQLLAAHPDRRDVRLLAAALRDGRSICLLRQREHDADDKVAMGHDIAPGLVAALQATLEADDTEQP